MGIIPAQKRIDGMYGEIYVGGSDVSGSPAGTWYADVVNITGTITVERKPINPAGSTQTFNKRGRVTREGSLQFDKVDSRLEKQFIDSVSQSIDQRRAARNTAATANQPAPSWFNRFRMVVSLDDPDSWGKEEIVLYNCEFWTLPIGFSLSEMRQTELQFTWEYESVATEIVRPAGA